MFVRHARTNRTFKDAGKTEFRWFHTAGYSDAQTAGSVNASLCSSVPEAALSLLCHVPVACRTVAGILVAASTPGWAWPPPRSRFKPARTGCHQELKWDLVCFLSLDEDVCVRYKTFLLQSKCLRVVPPPHPQNCQWQAVLIACFI